MDTSGETESLLSPPKASPASSSPTDTVGAPTVAELDRTRNIAYLTTFLIYCGFGIFSELYTDIFLYEIDGGSYVEASLYSTVAYTGYAVLSFVCSPLIATMSDRVGRKPAVLLAVWVDAITYFLMGFCKQNWQFIVLNSLQGGGDASYAVFNAMMSDYCKRVPRGHAGGPDDDLLSRCMHLVLRLDIFGKAPDATEAKADGARAGAGSEAAGEGQEVEGVGGKEGTGNHGDGRVANSEEAAIGELITIRWVYATIGYLAGIWLGAILYDLTSSYPWSMASGGLVIIPALFLVPTMAETVDGTQPLANASFEDSVKSTIATIGLVVSRRALLVLFVVNFTMNFVSNGLQDVVIYWVEWKFDFGTTQVAVSMSLLSLFTLTGAMAFPGLLGNPCGYRVGIVVMTMLGAAGCVACGVVTNSFELYVCICVVGFAWGVQPALLAQMCVGGGQDVGKIQGLNYALVQLASFSGPYVFWWMYSSYVGDDDDDDKGHRYDTQSSMFLWVSAILMGLSALLLLWTSK